MKNPQNKTKLTTIFVITILMTSAFILLTNSPVQAQTYENKYINKLSEPLPPGVTPDYTSESKSYISFRPNPVGLNQIFLVNFWIHPPIHNTRRLADLTVTITKPSGQQHVVKVDSYPGDGTGWFEWLADEIGTWTLKFDFPGGYYPPGNYTLNRIGYADSNTEFEESVYYLPSSDGPYDLVGTRRYCTILASSRTSNRLLDKTSTIRKQRMVANLGKLSLVWRRHPTWQRNMG